MVQLRERSIGVAVARRLFRRAIGRTGYDAELAAPPTPGHRRHDRPPPRCQPRLDAHRHATLHSRTYVRRADRRSHRLDGQDRCSGNDVVVGAQVVGASPTRLLQLIDWYQRAVEGRPSPCRFTPSCSSYAREALEGHGVRRGMWLTIRRLARCRPFGPSGFDPVPRPRPRPDRTNLVEPHPPALSVDGLSQGSMS